MEASSAARSGRVGGGGGLAAGEVTHECVPLGTAGM